MNFRTSQILMLVLLIAACSAPLPEVGRGLPVVPEATVMPVSANKDAKMSEARLLIESAAVLASQSGDLNGDGNQDVVLVLDHPENGEAKLGKAVRRSLILLVRDDSGQLSKAGQNDAIVPCAKCGGMTGDPYGYVRVESGAFTVLIEGGSRERWFEEYVFGYSVEEKNWLLDKVIHGVTDTITGEAEQTELTRKDFGVIEFDEFDPSMLPWSNDG